MKVKIYGKEIDYQPFKDEMYFADIKEQLEMNKSFRKVFKIDYTDKFLNMLKGVTDVSRRGFNMNTVLSIHGKTGQGKSSFIFSLGLSIFPHFSEKNVFFEDQAILNNAKNFREHDLIVRDENPSKAVFGQGSIRTAGQFGLLAETCRKASLNLALIEPSFQQNGISKWYLHIIDQSLDQRITRAGLIHPDTQRYIGCVCLPIMPENHPEWVKYQKRKDDFIRRMKKGDFSGSKLDYKNIAKQFINSPNFEKYKNKTEKKAYLVNKYQNYTMGEIETILAFVNIIKRENE